MSEFGGLCKHQNNPACAKSVRVFIVLKLDTIGWFSEAGLHERMPFVIFRARSRERSQRHFRADFWVLCFALLCFTLRITVKVEPRIAKQHKCHHCCSCKNYWGKGMEGGKKCLRCFLADRFASLWKKCVWGNPIAWATSNAFKVGSVKFSNSLSRLPLWRKYTPEVKAAKGLKWCRAKVQGVNNPAWTTQ